MRRNLIIVLGVITLVLISAFPAIAFVKTGKKWPSNSVVYDKHTLSTDWASRVWDGAYGWNAVTPAPFNWSASNSGDNDVYLGAIDGRNGVLAQTRTWSSGETILRINIVFDSGETWYTGASNPSSSQLDAWSIAAHELGHGLGLDHTQWNHCLPGWPATMCLGYSYGSTWARSLENDDRNGINDIYR